MFKLFNSKSKKVAVLVVTVILALTSVVCGAVGVGPLKDIVSTLSATQSEVETTPVITRSDIIPEGATYTVKATNTVLSAGQAFPETPANGDIYQEGDYQYTYLTSEWAVKVKNTSKSSYGEFLSEIAGKPVTHMYGTFDDCQSLVNAPKIPEL